MKIAKNKTIVITIATFLILSMTASMIQVPNANAHTPAWQVPTYAYIAVAPNPIGVGQTAWIYVWIDLSFPNAQLANNYRWHNYKLTITTPNGTTETKIWDVVSDTTSNQGYSYTPTEVGTYTLNFTFPGQDYNTYSRDTTLALVNDTFLPSTASTTLIVKQEPIPAAITSYPLPTNYWSRPIYGENTDWWSISSNWLGSGSPGSGSMIGPNAQMSPGDAVGSATNHVMWTYQLQEGGVVGGSTVAQGANWFGGTAYNPRYQNPIIMNGYLYYTKPVNWAPSAGTGGPTVCQDLCTGQIIWSRDDVPQLSFGYIYNVWTPNYHGVYAGILFTAGWARAFDAYTGDPLFNVTGVPTGATVLGPQGEQLKYVMANAGTINDPDWRLGQWNSSKLFFISGSASPAITNMTGTTVTIGSVVGSTLTGTLIVDASISNSSLSTCRYDWNTSIPWLNTMGATTIGSSPGANPVTILAAFYGNMLLCRNGTYPTISPSSVPTATWAPYTYFAVNLNASRGAIGSILWMQTYNPPPGNLTVIFAGADLKTGVFVENYREGMQYVGYSLSTGQKLWGPTASQADWDYYGSPGPGSLDNQIAYGRLYSDGMAGILYCYDLTNGNLLWTYGNGGEGNSTYSGFNTVYGNYPTMITDVGNGIIYTVTCEHTITAPIYKGALARAINATDGTEIWSLSDFTGAFSASPGYAIADGYSTFFNEYDSQVYSLGRGPSATTVSAPDIAISFGASIVIKGTVTDISAGTKQSQQAADFPNGVPVASDDSMKDWMGYVYQQKPLPTNATGVTVSISVLDSNNNSRTIGTTTTDLSGAYSYQWKPDIPGKYTVYASFAGTNGYWPSSSETSFAVDTAIPTQIPIINASSNDSMYFVASTVAIIVAIAIVGALILILVRKRP